MTAPGPEARRRCLWVLLNALFALLLSLSASLAAWQAPSLETYAQSLRLQPGAGVDAAKVSVTLAPLLNDAEWAFTQRWDDNLIDSLRVRDMLNRRRMHGSFYLNASDAWYGNETRYPFTGDPSKLLAPALLKGGHSIGGHGLTHSYVPAMNRPEMFYETLGVRIDREVNSQSAINSFVFPFTYFRNSLEGDAVHRDIAQQLINAGYIHVANQYFNTRLPGGTPLLDSWLLPCDGQSTDAAIKALLDSPRQQQREPVLCVCMHAWPAQWGGNSLPKLNQLLLKWRGKKHWWYANGNELSAYRWQAQHGTLQAQAAGGGLDLQLRRFEPWDLGDRVDLTLLVTGAGPLTPTASLGGVALSVQRGRRKGSWLVQVPHSEGHKLPAAFDWHRNPENRSDTLASGTGAIQGLSSRLWAGPDSLHLLLKNDGPTMEGLRIAWRLPLGTTPIPATHRDRLKSGDTLKLSLPLGLEDDPLLQQGRWYGAAQIDFEREGQRLRLYSDTRLSAPPRDPSLPKGGFWVLGPLPSSRKDFNLPLFAKRQLARPQLSPCQTLFKDQQACWEPQPAARIEPLHPELIPAGATQAPRTFYTWDASLYYPHGHGLHYLLAADIHSPKPQVLRAHYPRAAVKRILLNGKPLKGRRLHLHPGANRLLIYYAAGTPDSDSQGSFNILNYGPFFRLVDSKGQRAKDIQYLAPAELAAAARLTKP